MTKDTERTLGTGGSRIVERCQACGRERLDSALFLGYMPPVNQMRPIGERPREQPAYPAELLFCPNCELVQIGLTVDPAILFPPDYPYTSGTTRVLHRNFENLADESGTLLGLGAADLIVDIGSNDGTLLSKFVAKGHRVLGIEPTDAGNIARAAGIPTETGFFDGAIAKKVRDRHGAATVVTAANCFAHIENIHEVIEGVLALLREDGAFISESHYLIDLIDTVQYDTVYHEHLRYYSLVSIANLLALHGLEVFHSKRIPSHGGSIRVYAARKGQRPISQEAKDIFAAEAARGPMPEQLRVFRKRTVDSKLGLMALLRDIKASGGRVYGISAPSRASTLATYVGLDAYLVDCILEIAGSRKIGRYLPGTLIPVIEESRLFDDPPDYALMLSWHIAEELIPKFRNRGYAGKFIVPLPEPRVV